MCFIKDAKPRVLCTFTAASENAQKHQRKSLNEDTLSGREKMLPGAIKSLGKHLSVSNGLPASGVTSIAPPTPIQAVATALGYISELDGKLYC